MEGFDTVLVRYGGIDVKSPRVRRGTEERLRRNVESAVARSVIGETEAFEGDNGA